MQQHQGQRQTIEQMRGQEAWRRVNQIKDESKDRKDNGQLEKDYRSRVRSLNSMIQINGLGSTLGFLKAKSKQENNEPYNASYLLLEHLTAWMSERNFIPSIETFNEDADDTEDDADEAETSVVAFGLWLRRFAEAELQSSLPQASNANASQNTEHESSTSTEPNENMPESSIEGTQQNGK